jgi:hypothetical protein
VLEGKYVLMTLQLPTRPYLSLESLDYFMDAPRNLIWWQEWKIDEEKRQGPKLDWLIRSSSKF